MGYVDGEARFRQQAKDASSSGTGCSWAANYESLTTAITQEGCCGPTCNDESGCRAAGGEFATNTCTCDLQPSPILIDLNGDNFDLTDAAGGVLFDILGNGSPQQIAWTRTGSDDVFLALDRNGNNRIENGTELFGNRTPQPPSFAPNGFEALRVFDANGDGVISSDDPIYEDLLLWRDINHNAVSEPVELRRLSTSGITAISLNYRESQRRDRNGNIFRFRSPIIGEGGKFAYDVFLVAENTFGR